MDVYFWDQPNLSYEDRMWLMTVHALWAFTGNDKEVNNWELV